MLTNALHPADFPRLRDTFLGQARVHDGAICTPSSIARVMVALLAAGTAQRHISVYDPYARFGELLAEFVRVRPDPTGVAVHADHPRPAELRLAGMWLAAADAALSAGAAFATFFGLGLGILGALRHKT